MIETLKGSAKALVGAATPGLVIAINDATAEANKLVTGLIAAAATGLLVWLTRNGAKT